MVHYYSYKQQLLLDFVDFQCNHAVLTIIIIVIIIIIAIFCHCYYYRAFLRRL